MEETLGNSKVTNRPPEELGEVLEEGLAKELKEELKGYAMMQQLLGSCSCSCLSPRPA